MRMNRNFLGQNLTGINGLWFCVGRILIFNTVVHIEE